MWTLVVCNCCSFYIPLQWFFILNIWVKWLAICSFSFLSPSLSLLFILGLEPTLRNSILLVVHLKITLGSAHRTILKAEDQTELDICKAHVLPSVLSLAHVLYVLLKQACMFCLWPISLSIDSTVLSKLHHSTQFQLS